MLIVSSFRYGVLPPLETDRFLCAFSHIFAGSYAAGYYRCVHHLLVLLSSSLILSCRSYKWAEILACDAFEAFASAMQSSDPSALPRVGRLYRDTILARGGGESPLSVFEAFRGRAPSNEPLLSQYGLDTTPLVHTA